MTSLESNESPHLVFGIAEFGHIFFEAGDEVCGEFLPQAHIDRGIFGHKGTETALRESDAFGLECLLDARSRVRVNVVLQGEVSP